MHKGLHKGYTKLHTVSLNEWLFYVAEFFASSLMTWTCFEVAVQCLLQLRIHPGRVTKESQIAFTQHAQDDI